jgi:hypothetical protein
VSRISIKAVVLGAIVDMGATMVAGIAFGIYAMMQIDLINVPKAQVGDAVAAFMHGSLVLRGLQFAAGAAASVLGGYVAARVANRDALLNGALSAFLCMVLGVVSIVFGTNTSPLPVVVLDIVLSPLFGLAGGSLRLARQRRVPPAVAG